MTVEAWGAALFNDGAGGHAIAVGRIRVDDATATLNITLDKIEPAVIAMVPGERVIAVIRGDEGDERCELMANELSETMVGVARQRGRAR